MRPAFPIVLALSALPLHALDIAGNVLDKQWNPIVAAKVCVKSDASVCVTTGPEGDFHLTKAIPVRPSRQDLSGFHLAYRKGALIVKSPSAAPARIEWLTADGRRAFAVSEARLAPGNNAVPLPPGLPHTGVCILRLAVPDHVLAWKAVLAPGGSTSAEAAAPGSPRIAALSKAAAATLEITKTGYRTRIYEPAFETDSDVIITMSQAGDLGLEFGGTMSVKVLSIDRTKKTITTQSIDVHCDLTVESQIIRDTSELAQNYALRNGKLWIWDDKSCTGEALTGTATDIIGHWTLSDPSALLPEDLRAGCIPDTSEGGNPFETFSGDYNITESLVTAAITAEMCPGDLFGELFGYFLATEDTAIVTSKNTCKQVVYKNGRGESGIFDFTKKGDTLHSAFTYNTTTCGMDMDFDLSPKDPVCPEDELLGPFLACLAGTGFSDPGPLVKAAAAPARLPMSRERHALAVSLAFPKSVWPFPARDPGRREEYIFHPWKAVLPTR